MKKYYEATKKFHRKFKMKGTNNEDMQFRLNLLIEELGELSQAVTRGKTREEIFEENVDLLNLILGNFVSMNASLEEIDKAFWKKHEKIMNREKRLMNGNFRVSHFGDRKLK
jgi:NTP pyrophosphatase (non-canonical NTP hydrolase)